MAFHVACPITCQRICFCELGFPRKLQSGKARSEFLEEIARVEEFLSDPWSIRPGESTVQVVVPRVVPTPVLPPSAVDDGGGGDGEEIAASSVQTKRAALQRQAVAASLAAEDYVRRLETGGAVDILGEAASNLAGEDQGFSTVKVMCRICFSGESEGSEKALKMSSCKICNKKYHRSCLKSWASYRDLFHWSSWACPSCRVCEVCRRAGDPSKLMFCKSCDDAYHCYCQLPPHKNPSHGPYLCPKHTRCHSCGSTVSGNGLSTRWFLGYTCCDACGRLFVKGKYCPVCLKVYRDSELTPMVCCDVCQRWVHCVCDGISDEKYQQFQAERNLYYKCAACRGDCYQVKDIDDAVRELWRRRDKADRDLIASLRAAAGLPSQEEIFSISPYSDDEESGPVVLKNDYGRPLKFSVKGLSDKPTKNLKEYGENNFKNSSSNKKYAKKKGYQVQSFGKLEESYQSFERHHETRSLDSSFKDENIENLKSHRTDGPEIFSPPMTRSPGNDIMKSFVDQLESCNNNFTQEVVVNNHDKVLKVQHKGSKSQGLHIKEGASKNSSKNENVKGTKLVIHLGSKNRNMISSPRSEASSYHREQDLAVLNGSEDNSQHKTKDSEKYMLKVHSGDLTVDKKGAKLDSANQNRSSKYGERENSVINLEKVSGMLSETRGHIGESKHTTACRTPLIIGKRSTVVGPEVETPVEATLRTDEVLTRRQSTGTPTNIRSESRTVAQLPSISNSSNDSRPLLKLKFKNPYFGNKSSWTPSEVDEKNSVKGQRSKRKRPSMEKMGIRDNQRYSNMPQENPIDEVMDANWILRKLGKDAIGKRVEVHQSSDNSWHKGVVSNFVEGTSSISVHLDDGRSKTLELEKERVRFISQKQKRTKT